MAEWSKESSKLKKGHSWKATPGFRIFVADRGAVRFNIPEGWIIEPDSDSIKFYDGKPPDDNCRLACSYLRLPPIDWSGLHLSELIKVATQGDPRQATLVGEIFENQRPDLELAWADFEFLDPQEQRKAFTRICIARGSGIQALITLDYWPEDGARLAPMWQELLSSLQLGRYVADPTVGDVVN
jgi:hypothetical protein